MKKLNLKFIKERRSELRFTLQEMAEHLDFKNASTYMKYENGEYSFKANHIPLLAEKLGCEIDLLFFDESFAESAKTSTA